MLGCTKREGRARCGRRLGFIDQDNTGIIFELQFAVGRIMTRGVSVVTNKKA